MPLVTQVVSGAKRIDPLYISAIDQVRTGVGRRGLLYVGLQADGAGDAAHLATGGDDYLAPLALNHLPQAAIDAYLNRMGAGQALTPSIGDHRTDRPSKIAEGFECSAQLTATVGQRIRTWTERRSVVRRCTMRQPP